MGAPAVSAPTMVVLLMFRNRTDRRRCDDPDPQLAASSVP
jgi:hypothetical protein